MKSLKSLILVGFVGIVLTKSPTAHADLISPNNKNSAIKITLPLAADQYYDFSVTLDGRSVKVGVAFPIDPTKCLNFVTDIKALALSVRTKYCGDFKEGQLTEIALPSIQFSSPALPPDTVMFDSPHNYNLLDANNNGFAVSRFAHDFAYAKLIPFLTDSKSIVVTTTSVVTRTIGLTLQPTSKVFSFPNPNAARPSMTFQRVGARVFPDAIPLTLDFSRYLNVPKGSGIKIRKRVVINQSTQTLFWLKMFWDEYDQLCMTQLNAEGEPCYSVYSTGGKDAQGKEVASNYPTMINVSRIDVDDVTVHSEDGLVKIAPGTYTVEKIEASSAISHVGQGLPTKTGLDVLPGSYRVTVSYTDPFTFLKESKIYNLNFK